MKIRLEGTEREIEAVLHELPSIVEVREVSRFYLNHGSDRAACSTGGTTETPNSSTAAPSSTKAAQTFTMKGAFDLFVTSAGMQPGTACAGSGASSYARAGAPVKVFDGQGHLLATGALANARFESNPIGAACVFDLTVEGVPDGYSSYSVEVADQGAQPVASSSAHTWVFLHDGP